MNSSLRLQLEDHFSKKVCENQALSGGCINDTQLWTFSDQMKVVTKFNPKSDMALACEANGLKELNNNQNLLTPQVYFVSDKVLCIEYIESAPPQDIFWREFGTGLARLHQEVQSPSCGFYEDNFIGSNPQRNQTTTSWVDFFFENRLGFQMNLARQTKDLPTELQTSFEKLYKKRFDLLGPNEEEPYSLLHGDLWSGNYICSTSLRSYLIDPAVYYGHREADLAITFLFGGFPKLFYEAYQKEWPLQFGWKKRLPVYMLYHVLNHWNLFGDSYLPQALNLVDEALAV